MKHTLALFLILASWTVTAGTVFNYPPESSVMPQDVLNMTSVDDFGNPTFRTIAPSALGQSLALLTGIGQPNTNVIILSDANFIGAQNVGATTYPYNFSGTYTSIGNLTNGDSSLSPAWVCTNTWLNAIGSYNVPIYLVLNPVMNFGSMYAQIPGFILTTNELYQYADAPTANNDTLAYCDAGDTTVPGSINATNIIGTTNMWSCYFGSGTNVTGYTTGIGWVAAWPASIRTSYGWTNPPAATSGITQAALNASNATYQAQITGATNATLAALAASNSIFQVEINSSNTVYQSLISGATNAAIAALQATNTLIQSVHMGTFTNSGNLLASGNAGIGGLLTVSSQGINVLGTGSLTLAGTSGAGLIITALCTVGNTVGFSLYNTSGGLGLCAWSGLGTGAETRVFSTSTTNYLTGNVSLAITNASGDLLLSSAGNILLNSVGGGHTVISGIASTVNHTPVSVNIGSSPFTFSNTIPVNLKLHFVGQAAPYTYTMNGVSVYTGTNSVPDDLAATNVIVLTYSSTPPILYTNAW
jgi:hypothetical protein